MKIFKKRIPLETKKQFEIIDITQNVLAILKESGVVNGQILVFCPHTTASIRMNHAEPLLMQDIMKMMYRLAPVDINYAHDVFEIRENVSIGERSNGHAHVKAFLLGASETIPVENANAILGERQSVFFVELDGARKRDYVVQVMGE